MEAVAMKHLCIVLIVSWLSVMNGKVAGLVNSQPATQTNLGAGSGIADCLCKKGFIRLSSGKCYLFVFQVKSWPDALASCRGVGTTLAYPMNVVEESALATHLRDKFNGLNGWYLGGTDQAELDHWRWAHNNASLTYFDWSRDQPDSPGGDERCLQFFDGRWQWNNVNCDVLNPFVCQQF